MSLKPVADYLAALLIRRGQGEDAYTMRTPPGAPSSRPQQIDLFSRRAENVKASIADIERYLDAKAIANKVHGEISFTLNNRLEEAWKVFSTDYPYPSLHNIAGKLKKAKQGTPEHEFLTTVAPLAAAWKRFKDEGMIFKRQPKPVEDAKAKYLAPRAGNDAKALVQQALIAVTDAHFQALVDQITGELKGAVKVILDALQMADDATYTMQDLNRYGEMRRKEGFRTRLTKGETNWTGLSADERAASIAKAALRQASDIREQFIIKNLTKLDSIIERKGDFLGIQVLSHTVSLASMEGTLLVTFKDGSRFTVQNSVVWSVSVNGKPFYRFPLTFHYVHLFDKDQGKVVVVARPSEERMNTVFVGVAP